MTILKFLFRFLVAMVVASISGAFGMITMTVLLRYTLYRKHGPGPDDSEWFNSAFLALPFGLTVAVILLLRNFSKKNDRVFKER
ncbi:hypothetical protein WJU23_19710 [Prosthecobacter sp. SYSU 5D2]|uniref:hypothetical protein n=1 Tax=Prosthecobacter sp. SYSU 5D2 TaxID=3134134 RepID=UPI0031FECF2D